MQKKSLIPAVAGVTALALVGGVAAASAFRTYDVTLTVDGKPQAIEAKAGTVADVLAAQGIKVKAHDVVQPSADTEITDGLAVAVNYARPFEVSVDGKKRQVWTTARTVQEALGYLNLDAKDSLVSTSRSANIGRQGLSVDVVTAKDVTLVSNGQETPVRLAGTVGDVLEDAGIKLDGDDIVKPAASTNLTDGMKIQFTDVEVKSSTKDVKVLFEKTKKKSKKMDKGDEKVTTKGVDGLKRETYRDVYHDGKKVSSKKTDEKVVKKPVTEVTTVGTKKVDASAAASDELPATSGPRTGTKYDWMRAAGIPEDQWQYVDYIVTKESGWNPNAKNPSSGACGLAQAYPCSKLGPNWNDPVVALQWQYNYVNGRYGGYAGAYKFWRANRWY